MIRPNGQCTGLQVERSRFETWLGQYDVFLSKTLSSHDASLHPGVEWMSAGKLSGKPDEMLGAHLRWTGIPVRGSSNTLSCCPLHGNQYKLQLARPIGSSTDLL